MKAITKPRYRHFVWVAVIILSVLVSLAVRPTSRVWQERLTTEQKRLSTQKDRLQLQIHQWTQDAQAAHELAKTLAHTDVERLLAPANRAEMTAQLEPLAAAARLAHVVYTLSPTQIWDGADHFPGIKGVTISTLSLDADAPDDGDVFDFVKSLDELPGRFELNELHITPTQDKQALSPQALNLHMKASLHWIANAEERTP